MNPFRLLTGSPVGLHQRPGFPQRGARVRALWPRQPTGPACVTAGSRAVPLCFIWTPEPWPLGGSPEEPHTAAQWVLVLQHLPISGSMCLRRVCGPQTAPPSRSAHPNLPFTVASQNAGRALSSGSFDPCPTTRPEARRRTGRALGVREGTWTRSKTQAKFREKVPPPWPCVRPSVRS